MNTSPSNSINVIYWAVVSEYCNLADDKWQVKKAEQGHAPDRYSRYRSFRVG